MLQRDRRVSPAGIDRRVHQLILDSRKGTGSLVTTLVDVTSGSIIRPQHGDDTVRVPIGSGNVRPLGSDVVNVETDPTGRLGDHGTRLERVVDALDRVVLHGDQEARGELRVRSTGVEELFVEGRRQRQRDDIKLLPGFSGSDLQ